MILLGHCELIICGYCGKIAASCECTACNRPTHVVTCKTCATRGKMLNVLLIAAGVAWGGLTIWRMGSL